MNGKGKLRVAAYIRVSTENPEQEESYELQERYFSKMLSDNSDWICAGIYSDYGISATSDKKRVGFQRLLRHCREEKIDRIVCKSISRFARNTSDFMEALKVLREHAVTIYFEKENLDTADSASDFILTALGAIAQEESRSISENIRWGFQKRYPKGEAKNCAIYGYRYADGEDAYEVTETGYKRRRIEIVEEEAAVVRRIFQMTADGESFRGIARKLNHEGIPAPENCRDSKRKREGKDAVPYVKGELKEGIDRGWTAERIRQMVRMERYCGDMVLQKVFTSDFLSHKMLKNSGERPMYYVQDNHMAIVDRELFRKVQTLLKREAHHKTSERHVLPFSGRIVCGHCGRFFHSRNRSNHPIWACPSAYLYNGKQICTMERIYEEQLIRVFRKAVIERFRLLEGVLYDDVKLADIFSGRFLTGMEEALSGEHYIYTKYFDSFVEQIRVKLEYVHQMDYAERDRTLIKRQIYEAQKEGEKRAFYEKLTAMEEYWRELEQDYMWRDRAIEWMKGLPEGREGTIQFLNGLTDVYVKAFVLSVTVYSPLKYTIHWFDNICTDVIMDNNIEDHRLTAMYWDGNKMCEKQKYK